MSPPSDRLLPPMITLEKSHESVAHNVTMYHLYTNYGVGSVNMGEYTLVEASCNINTLFKRN